MMPSRSAVLPVMSVVAAAFGCAFAAAGCSSSSPDPNPSTMPAATTTACAMDTRKDVYVAGLTKTTPSGIAVKVMDASPAPPAKLSNTLTLQVTDATGKSIDGASLTIVPWMPDHGHGSAIKPGAAAMGNGVYDVTNLYYPMPGLWRVTVTINTPDAAAQDAVFNFCIDG